MVREATVGVERLRLPPEPAPCDGRAVPLPLPTIAALALVVLIAFTVETAIGFGATVVTVALGSFVTPIEALLPAYVPVNMLLSLYIAARYRRDVDRRLLFGRIAPLMGLGMPAGILLFRNLGSARLQLAFGVFVVTLAIVELLRPREAPARPIAAPIAAALLIASGVIHGVFGTGGPLTVYVTGRSMADKARFRATLSTLWLVLNVFLVGSYVTGGQLRAGTPLVSAVLIPPLLLGMLLGERAHRRVPEEAFRRLVFVMLLGAGAMLALRAAR